MNKVATDLLYRVSYQVKRIADLRHTPASNSINKSYWLYPPTEDQAPHESNTYLSDSAFTFKIDSSFDTNYRQSLSIKLHD